MYSSPPSCCCFSPTVQIVSRTRVTLRRMMMMVTVRRRVACDLLVLALLCCCLPVSVAATPGLNSTAAPAKPLLDVVVLCPGQDGKLRWRIPGDEWRKCAKKPGEADGDNGNCARLCNFAGDIYNEPEITSLCASANDTRVIAFHMSFMELVGLTNCTLGEAPKMSPYVHRRTGDANENLATGPENSSRPSSSPSGDDAANEASHNNNEGKPTTDGIKNGATAVWLRTPLLLLLLVTAVVCAALR
ncbi:surface antigen TASV-A8, putative,surface antigen TASV, putative [Trypanosoma cruzi marinkellei]|uniref:Surface antigen TASV-A8, putative,surface antigen TASV, putative n=1 Tax=Trypanosoma cruzi marinkellei TaxID=85056 RepID=K2LTM9_TRYCR|nr:surface antigen TASV-A8, putative,surface antigen TASV, putative [Trypanosoma cruzi marinkellei]EKF26063.1 surface antigen TASV-A8, putative,surface antigen TASV, putative [Trypanosoma cruzi marinkellei]